MTQASPRLTKRRNWFGTSMRRYLAIGVSVYIFELAVIVTAQALGAGSLLAVGLAFWLGILASFVLQKLVTFGDKRLHHKIVLEQSALFLLLVLFNFGFTLLVTKLLISIMPAVACRTVALVITTTWNFYLYKTRIFSQQASAAKQLSRRYSQWRSQPKVERFHDYASQPGFGKLYLLLSLAVLLGTTLLWSLLGAHLQQGNADQLANAHLFSNRSTLSGATFPDQHSFLIKWPLFYLIMLFGYTAASFIWVTVLTVILTVAVFVFVLSRIERRPLALGTLCLMLASVLLLVPAQPYAGALLPVNMAMLTTRNLEYVLYIASLFYLIKAPGLRSRQFLWAALLLGLLVASDKLFLPVSALGALLAMLFYTLRKRWELVTLSANWLLAAIAAAAGAALAIAAVNHAHITHIAGSQAGPYGLAHGAKSVTLGVIYAIGGLLTNFGANPAYDATTLRRIPHQLLSHLLSPAGPAYIINLLILALCLCVAGSFLLNTMSASKKKASELSAASKLSMLLLWSSAAVTGLFIVTNHYYQVDARYLTLWLFSLFVLLAVWLRAKHPDPEATVIFSAVLLAGIALGSIGSIQTYNSQKNALADVNHRDKVIAQTLDSHHVKLLIGDYWRVLPVKSLSTGQSQQVMPLEKCGQPRTVLSSKSWQPDLHKTSFAYLLTFDGSLTGYPNCSLHQVTAVYGKPNSSALIDGTLEHPKELLLFYDRGIHLSQGTASPTQNSATILPIPISDLPHTSCPVPTIMNIVAHQDDDLLFMSPDLLNDIAQGHCVRSVYLTAGDAGSGRPYWLSREQGSEAAYSEMIGSKAVWIQRIVRLPGGQFVTVANPRANYKISLIFMHLPDGNPNGTGFTASRHQSLAELQSKQIKQLQTVDGQSSYTADQLTEAITTLLHTYQPAEIRTQSGYAGQQYKDHSDHLTTGKFVARAYKQYEDQQFSDNVTIPLVFYVGYPVHQLPPNVSGLALQTKKAAFMAYSKFDGGVCQSEAACQHSNTYGIYLSRQYRRSN